MHLFPVCIEGRGGSIECAVTGHFAEQWLRSRVEERGVEVNVWLPGGRHRGGRVAACIVHPESPSLWIRRAGEEGVLLPEGVVNRYDLLRALERVVAPEPRVAPAVIAPVGRVPVDEERGHVMWWLAVALLVIGLGVVSWRVYR